MQIANRYRKLVSYLPYDAEVEWLQATGTQYISTGPIMPIGQGLKIKYVFKLNSRVNQSRYFNLNVNNAYYENGKNWYFDCYQNGNGHLALALQGTYDATSIIGWSGIDFGISNTNKTTFNFSWDNLENDTVTGYNTVKNLGGLKRRVNANISLLAMASGANKALGRVYSFRAELDDEIKVDLIPVRKSGVGYLYDKVSGKLFGNKGTGNFVIGPDKKTAKDYIQDGLIAMWDGIENAGWGINDTNANIWKDLIGDNDLTFTKSGNIYFASDCLYAQSGLAANGNVSKIPAGLDYITYEVCWNRVSNFAGSADSIAQYGTMRIDAYTSKLWYRCTLNDGGWMNTPPSNIGLNIPFTQAFTARYNLSRNNLIPFVNGNRISNTTTWSAGLSNIVQFGSGYNSPISKHHCIRVYSRTLTDAELLHNYLIDKTRFSLP